MFICIQGRLIVLLNKYVHMETEGFYFSAVTCDCVASKQSMDLEPLCRNTCTLDDLNKSNDTAVEGISHFSQTKFKGYILLTR